MCIHQLQSLPTDETMDVQVWLVGFRWLVGWQILPWGTGFANKKRVQFREGGRSEKWGIV